MGKSGVCPIPQGSDGIQWVKVGSVPLSGENDRLSNSTGGSREFMSGLEVFGAHVVFVKISGKLTVEAYPGSSAGGQGQLSVVSDRGTPTIAEGQSPSSGSRYNFPVNFSAVYLANGEPSGYKLPTVKLYAGKLTKSTVEVQYEVWAGTITPM